MKQITIEFCRHHFTEVLRRYVGVGREFSVERAGDTLDIDRRTMHSYLLGENLPGLVKFFRMCVLFGPRFINGMLQFIGFGGCYRLEPQPVTDFELNGDVCALVGSLGKAFRNGRIDHRAQPEIIDAIRELVPVLQEWQALHDPVAANDDIAHEIDTTPRGAA